MTYLLIAITYIISGLVGAWHFKSYVEHNWSMDEEGKRLMFWIFIAGYMGFIGCEIAIGIDKLKH